MQGLVFYVAYPFLWLIAHLPDRLLYGLSDGICFLIYRLIGYRKKVVRRNLCLAFSEKPLAEIKQIEAAFYHHFCDIFLEMVRTMGLSQVHILKTHILPFIYKPILIIVLMNIGNIILMISGFSFLGIGVQPNITEWGMMLHDARSHFQTATWMMLAPGLAIFLTVVAFNLFAECFEEKGWKQIWKK